jgi:hypothetical protein
VPERNAARFPGRGLWTFVFVDVVLLNALMIGVFSAPWYRTGPALIVTDYLRGTSGNDSWLPINEAYDFARFHPDRPLYDTLFFEQRLKFQYPLTALLPWYALKSDAAARGLAVARISEDALVTALSWLSVLATVLISMAIFRRARREAFPEDTARPSVGTEAALLVLGLTFYPLLKGYEVGNVQVWLDALFAAAFLLWMRGAEVASGALLGLCTLVKPQLGILLLWGVLRRRWKFAGAFLAIGLLGALAAVLLFGVSQNLGYLPVLSYIARHGEAFYANQSVNGLLNRLLFNGNSLKWNAHAYAPYAPLVYAGTLVSSLVVLALGLAARPPRTAAGRGADFALAALASTMASPVAWEHHYGILLPIFAFLWPTMRAAFPDGRWALAALAASYVVASNAFSITNRVAHVPVLNVVQSYLFASAVAVFVLLWILRRSLQRRAAPATR